MRRTRGRRWFLVFGIGAALVASRGRAERLGPDAKLPDVVLITFKTAFPKAEIGKVDTSEENGVTVYDFEFKEGKAEKETDIAADGTLLEFTLVIAAKVVPAPAMKAIRRAAQGAKLGRLEKIEIGYETKDGNVVKLPEVVTQYAAEMARGSRRAEVVVAADGAVIESPRWAGGEEEKAKAAGNEGK